MTPYYTDDAVTLYHGDCLDVLPALEAASIDAIVTDPPYNVSVRCGRLGTTSGRLTRKDGTKREVTREFGGWDFGWDPGPFLAQSVRLLRDGGSLVAFTSEFLIPAYLASGLDHRSLLFWRKSNPAPNFRRLYVRSVEMAVWQTKGGGWTFNGGGYVLNCYDGAIVSGYSTVNLGEQREHPTQKPVSLMNRLLATHTDVDVLVLDPFAGSGSTLRAAKDLGRKAIGVEIDERYCEIAARRLAQEVLA